MRVMSKKDRVNREIDDLSFWRSIAVAVIIAILGWIFTTYDSSSLALLIAGVLAIVILAIILYALHKAIKKRIKKLDKL